MKVNKLNFDFIDITYPRFLILCHFELRTLLSELWNNNGRKAMTHSLTNRKQIHGQKCPSLGKEDYFVKKNRRKRSKENKNNETISPTWS